MRLKYSFETMKLDDWVVAVPVGDGAQELHGVVKLNESAAEIFNLLKEETTEEAIVAKLKERFGNESEIPGFVRNTVECLKSKGILE